MCVQIKRDNQLVIDIYNKYRKSYRYHTIQELIDFVNTYNRLPHHLKKEEWGLNKWMKSQIKKGNKEVIDIFNRFNKTTPLSNFTYKYL